jgi:hypothetical protein
VPAPEELNHSLLERARERHEDSRSTFLRDLKLCAVALVAFQFLVFFRYASLSDRQFALGPQLAQAQADHQALVEVTGALDRFKNALVAGSDKLAALLLAVPDDIRTQLGRLNEELQAQRNSSSTGRELIRQQPLVNVPNLPAQRFQQAPLVARNLLEDPNAEPAAVQTAVNRMVETEVIRPTFARLNSAADRDLVGPLAAALTDLRKKEVSLAILRKAGADVDRWLSQADQVVVAARTLRFQPPATADWWTTARTKADFAAQAVLDVNKAAGDARSALGTSEGELRALAQKMDTALTGLKRQADQITAELERLEENSSSLQQLLDGYAKPLAVVALDPKDLVIFYPVLLAAVLAIFAVRQWMLRREALALSAAYRELGVAEQVLGVCFDDARGRGIERRSSGARFSAWITRLADLVWIVPAALTLVSFGWILSSKSLVEYAPKGVYVLAGIVLVGACVFLIRAREGAARS